MADRALHFVGSVPAEVSVDAETGMRWLLDAAGIHRITALPSEDPTWIVPWLLNRRTVVDDGPDAESRAVFDIVSDGAAADYADMPVHQVPRRTSLRSEHVALGRVQQVRDRMPAFRTLRDSYGRPELRHQVSVPSPLDLALFTLVGPGVPIGPRARARAAAQTLRRYPVFRDAILDEVAELHDGFGDDLVYQLEAPSVLIGLWSAPTAARPVLARVLAGQIAGVLTRLPDDAEVVLHLCYGDLSHVSMVTPTHLKPVVQFLNALAAMLRYGSRKLPAVHVPAAFGDQPPPVDVRFYRPLARLDAGYRLYAGVADHRDPRISRTALRLFETESRRTASAVSTACGMGREPLDLATNAVAVCRELAHAACPTDLPV